MGVEVGHLARAPIETVLPWADTAPCATSRPKLAFRRQIGRIVHIGRLWPSLVKRSSHPSGFVRTSHTATRVLTPFDFLIVKPSASRSGTPVHGTPFGAFRCTRWSKSAQVCSSPSATFLIIEVSQVLWRAALSCSNHRLRGSRLATSRSTCQPGFLAVVVPIPDLVRLADPIVCPILACHWSVSRAVLG